MPKINKLIIMFLLLIFLSSCSSEKTITTYQKKSDEPTTSISEVAITEMTSINHIINTSTTELATKSTDMYDVKNEENQLFLLPDDMPQLKKLNLDFNGKFNILLQENCDLSFLSVFSELKGLAIDESSNPPGYYPLNESFVSDFSFLNNMIALSELAITQEPQFSLSCLNGMENLKKISLYGVRISDYNAVVETVEELTLDSCDFSLDEIVVVFPNLKKLTIFGYWDSISSIGELQNLETLILYQTSYQGIESIEDNNNLENITLLTRNGTDVGILESADFLFELENLKSLVIYKDTISQDVVSSFIRTRPDCDVQIYDT